MDREQKLNALVNGYEYKIGQRVLRAIIYEADFWLEHSDGFPIKVIEGISEICKDYIHIVRDEENG